MPDVDPWVLVYSVVCVFGAGVVRGYSGFGFSLLAITALSLVLTPVQIVPSIFMLELAASLHLLPGIWRQINWRAILYLMIGTVVATPFGVHALANVPAAPMTLAMAIFVLVAAALLARGFALGRMPGPVATVATGAATGIANGAFGIGGPPVVLFFLSSPAAVNVGRASSIAYFLGTDTVGLAAQASEGLIESGHLWRALAFLPALVVGVWLGARSFQGADPAIFRRWVLRILMVLAVLTGLKGAWALFAPV